MAMVGNPTHCGLQTIISQKRCSLLSFTCFKLQNVYVLFIKSICKSPIEQSDIKIKKKGYLFVKMQA